MDVAIDGQWGEWSNFTECRPSCGEGNQTRERSCNNPPPANNGSSCNGSDTEMRICHSGDCCEPILITISIIMIIVDLHGAITTIISIIVHPLPISFLERLVGLHKLQCLLWQWNSDEVKAVCGPLEFNGSAKLYRTIV